MIGKTFHRLLFYKLITGVSIMKMNKKQIGIFSGSFNPIHIGHLILANYITEFTNIDEVWFLVTPHNPLKEISYLVNEEHRLKMCRIAIKDMAKLKVSEIEFSMPKPSYTIDTLDRLKRDYPDLDFRLIIGADNWNELYLWKSYERLRSEFKLLVYPRLNEEVKIGAQFKDNVQLINAPIIQISSTFIRSSIKENKDVRVFLPYKIYEYIREHQLYE